MLSLLGWGLGFFYARQTRAALVWALASVLIGWATAAGLVAYLLTARSIPTFMAGPHSVWIVVALAMLPSIIVALIAWGMAARHQRVKRGSPVRLLGYLAIWLIPALVTEVSAMSYRSFYQQPFRIPSGNMEPTLTPGDYVIVSKASYGYGPYSTAPYIGLLQRDPEDARAPQRGDIAVFRPVSEPERDFVKRVVGLPGDRIQMIGGVLHIDGQPVQLEPLGAVSTERGEASSFRETLPNGVSYTVLDLGTSELDNTREFVVPDGHYFVMGDNRDNSADSRVADYVGYVPLENFVGRVDHIIEGPTTSAE